MLTRPIGTSEQTQTANLKQLCFIGDAITIGSTLSGLYKTLNPFAGDRGVKGWEFI